MLRCNARYIDSQENSVRYLYSPGGSLKYPSGPTTLLSDQLGGMLKKTGQHKTPIVFDSDTHRHKWSSSAVFGGNHTPSPC